jgi:hypothetical protein
MEKRFRALRLVGTLYKVLGVIVLILTLISATGICLTGVLGGAALRNMGSQFGMMQPNLGTMESTLMGVIVGLVSLVGGALGGLTLYATGEGIYLLISIEENTRTAVAQPPVKPTPVA